ncbi:hypothetical protein FOA52_011252 [Chlamydomonas sp. UWO 241]|nr:hypothetical protein FOA52_011252 [Chlamydomonas sp. UWO 241]
MAQEGGEADPELEALRGVLAKFLPDRDIQELLKASEATGRIRFGDLPATSKLMESFTAGKLPGEPVYDLPSWLEHNYPQFDATPKSPFYSWVVWSRDHLPRDQQRALHAFHDYMSHPGFRKAILRQANWELARLWDWQHRRAALGLAPELTPAEAAAALDDAHAHGGRGAAAAAAAGAGPAATAAPSAVGGTGRAPAAAAAPSQPAAAAAAPPPPPPPAPPAAPLPGILGVIQRAEAKPLPGILGVIQKAEVAKARVEAAVEERLVDAGLTGLTPEQAELVASLRHASSPGAALRSLAAKFESRIAAGSNALTARGRRVGRAQALLQAEFAARGADAAGAGRAGGDHTSAAATANLYVDAAGAKGEKSGNGVPLVALHPRDLRRELLGAQMDGRTNQASGSG